MKRILLGVVLAVTFAMAPATSLRAQPAREIFTEGETLDFVVTWLKVTGGTARMTIAPQGDNFRITSVAKSSGSLGRMFKIRDEIESIVAKSDFTTLRYTKRLDERGDKEREVTIIADGSASRTRANGKTKTVPVPDPVFDPISVVYHLRTLGLELGKSHDLTLISDGKVYTVKAKVVKREVIETPAGRFTTLMVEPEMVRGGVPREERLFIWYTDDERHIPVRIRTEVNFGSVVASLRTIQRGVTTADPPPLH